MTEKPALSSLKKQLQNAEQKHQKLLAEEQNIQKKIKRVRASIESLKSSITRMEEKTRNEIYISDSALLKYLKEVKGVNIEELKKEMLPEPIKKEIIQNGNGIYKTDSHSVKANKQGQVVTVYVDDIEKEALKNQKKKDVNRP